ncbi:HDL089Cp [Eremothecium sinecaudum]|uniref:Small ribosomal subunit protein bS18m n=1 Tax=Eremothecium sinecaudum TaxID=45286 RepID=A0A120K274_9SACH|nr:HDL089Cp [Eremothecium sinecaudum]AMD20655.1 HDL089Cp [Eremothecium sinecaudum]
MVAPIRQSLQLTSRRAFTTTKTGLSMLKLDLSSIEEYNDKKKPDTENRLDTKVIRKFYPSTVYDPFDFSMARIHMDRKVNLKNSTEGDIFKASKFNPLDLYTNPEFLSRFMSSTGKILHRDVTGLSAKNQRLISKAIKRAQAIGLLSKVHQDVNCLHHKLTGI